jgi:hypothetical protein
MAGGCFADGPRVSVKDTNGKGVEGVAVEVHDGDTTLWRGSTGREGEAVIKGDFRGVRQLWVTVGRAGYVGERWSWGAKDERDARPARVEAVLERASGVAGGVVVDEAGNTLAGARVAVDVEKRYGGEWKAAWSSRVVVADETGRWKVGGLPGGEATVRVGAIHESGLNADGGITLSEVQGDALAALMAGQGKVVIKRGETAQRVRVVDEAGKPLAGAKVWFGRSFLDHDAGIFLTDAAGEVAVRMPAGAKLAGGAMAEGHQVGVWMGNADGKVAEVQLLKGAPARLTVVDGAGKRMAGARVKVVATGQQGMRVPWEGVTGGDGEIVWGEAPGGITMAAVQLEGYMVEVGTMTMGEGSRATLQKVLVVEGKVVDKATGKAVSLKGMKLTLGSASPGAQIYWGPNARSWEAGTVEGTFYTRVGSGGPDWGAVLRVAPVGYVPAEAELLAGGPESVAAEFRVTAGKAVAGELVDGEGKPLVRREVVVVAPGQRMDIRNGELVSVSREALRVKTDDAGKFSFPPQPAGYLVVTVGKEGYVLAGADVMEGQGGKLFLQSWGQVAGTVTKQGDAAGKVIVEQHFGDHDRALVMLVSVADGDAEGAYVLRCVVPEKVMVGRRKDEETRDGVWSHSDGEIREAAVVAGAVTRMDVRW